jgi:hypothetical protein
VKIEMCAKGESDQSLVLYQNTKIPKHPKKPKNQTSSRPSRFGILMRAVGARPSRFGILTRAVGALNVQFESLGF